MLKINLLPIREARRAADLRQQVMWLVFVMLVSVGVLGLLHSRLSSQIDTVSMRVVQMEQDIKQFKPQLDQVAAYRKKKDNLEKKIDVIEGLDRARSGPVRVLDELASRAPDRLWLTSLTTKGKAITLKGESLDNELVALFLRGLGDSPYFEDVDLDSTKMGSEKNGLKLVNFSIRAVMVNPRPAKKDAGKA